MDPTFPAPELRPALPPRLADYLNGEELLGKAQALRLATVSGEGWPHAALLTAGEMLALPEGELRFCLYPQTTTALNLIRDGRCTMTWVDEGAQCEVRLRARRLRHVPADMGLACFAATVLAVREHRAPYADLTTGLRFQLHDPETVLARWKLQLQWLKEAQ